MYMKIYAICRHDSRHVNKNISVENEKQNIMTVQSVALMMVVIVFSDDTDHSRFQVSIQHISSVQRNLNSDS